MRARFVPLILAAMLLGPAVSGRAQDRQSSDEQRKALIESLFVDAARFHEAQDYASELDALEGVIQAANVLNDFKQKNTAALDRATNKVIALRSLAAQQVDAQVQVVRTERAEIERVTGQFSSLVSLDIALDRVDRDSVVSRVATLLREAAAFARQQEFSAGRVGLLTELTRAGERVTRVADQVCRAGSRDEAVAAGPAIETDARRAQEIEQAARRWARLRSGEEAGAPVDRAVMDELALVVGSASVQSSMLELSLADFESNRGQSRQDLEQAIRTLRSRLVQLEQEQRKLEPLLAFYQRCGAVVRFGEDQTPRWRIDVSADGTAQARSRVTALQTTLDAMSSWDAATARDAVRRVKAESDRLVAEWSEVGKILADTDAAATSAFAMVSEIRQRRDRATACVDGLSQRPAAPPPPRHATAPAVVPPAPARDANAVGGGTMQPPAQPAAPAPGAAQPQAPPPAAAPPVDPNVAGGIKIQGPTTRIGVGERVRFVATDYGNRLYTKVTWTSFDDELLSIDSQGRATGLRPGKLLIHAALDDERAATLSVEVVAQPATPLAPVTPPSTAAPQVPPATPTSGFQAGTTQAGPDNSRPAADSPAPAAATPPVTEASGSGRPSTNLLGIDVQGAPTPPAAGGFGMGATTAGRDPAPPPPGGGGQPGGGGGSGGQNPQRGTPPPGPGQQTRAVAGQPAAYHIFATGSRMGWASGLGQYSVGPADPSIVEHLQVAGEHIMWANRESFLPVTAWPNWPTNRAEVRSWADDLTRDPRNPTRRQITVRASSRASTLADELRYQTMGGPEHTATCDAAYMRLGYELGYGQQVLGIADEAARNGDRALARQARQDGMSHLQNSSRILSEYERIVSLTGRCADLRDVRTQLDAIYRLDIGDLSGQSRSTTAAWTLALERIAALRGRQPAPPAPTPPPSTPFFPPLPPARPQPGSGQSQTPQEPPGADPRDLGGAWFECAAEPYDESNGNDRIRPEMPQALERIPACLRDGPGPTSKLGGGRFGKGGFMVEFTTNGDRYVGRVAAGSPIMINRREPFGGAAFQYPPAGEVFRLTRTAAGTYEGEMFDRSGGCVPGACNPRWWVTRVTVDGDVARQVFPYFREKIYWVRWPPRHQAPASRQPAP